ncbi:hypothetical protein FR483_n125L [Paramecium bursaria Chlorella virus FR483]|uniref:Uncharacterized protein n125L n=1 Tax=Paramecium bursaria Chlorella virus FR483 TaxID=399781 RepID=A7J6H9_PBCVF|nr:hypothetical protein FR483_n125L [Paramecium bursaria Chlorella virus FR483]ABT15410.1 hypothetical protein FR483_n125L [Paramecium bursaria Chlorella virus FR483]
MGLEDTDVFRKIGVDRGTILVLVLAQNNTRHFHIIIIDLLVDFSHLQVFLLITIDDTDEPGDVAILRVAHALQALFKHKRVLAIASNYDCHPGGVPIIWSERNPIDQPHSVEFREHNLRNVETKNKNTIDTNAPYCRHPNVPLKDISRNCRG